MTRDLDAIADELYALRPDAFAAARDAEVRKARAERQQPLARELGGLRRPTQSAWLINLLWRDQREVMQQLFELADELSRAQAQAAGPALQRLTAQRRELEAALLRRARTLAESAGATVTPSVEREAQETLAAALARREVADEVRTGRLVKPAAYAGFGTLPTATEGQARSAARTPSTQLLEVHAAQRAAAAREAREAAERVAREAREAAERELATARAAFDAAGEALAEQGRAVDEAEARVQALRQEVEQLEARLRGLRDEVGLAEQAGTAVAGRRDAAQQAYAAARQAVARAEQSLQESIAAATATD